MATCLRCAHGQQLLAGYPEARADDDSDGLRLERLTQSLFRVESKRDGVACISEHASDQKARFTSRVGDDHRRLIANHGRRIDLGEVTQAAP